MKNNYQLENSNNKNESKIKILILGISGMLGNTMFRSLSTNERYLVYGTLRNNRNIHENLFNNASNREILINTDATNLNSINNAIDVAKPNVIINCIGIIKQLNDSSEVLKTIPVNTIFPHLLTEICNYKRIRLIHFSTDCVFSGSKGNYIEDDISDCNDLYGRSKYLGEISNSKSVITLRTSVIGHELVGNKSLVNWFLSQKQPVNGFINAVFSGLPAVEIASIISEYIIPNEQLYGLYHLASNPISKYDLLKLISNIYNKNIKIIPDNKLIINRSLNAAKFKLDTGYISKKWPVLIQKMYDDFINSYSINNSEI